MKLIYCVAISVLFPILLYSQGNIYQTNSIIRIAEGDTLSRQMIIAGEWIDMDGHITNDLFAAGKHVNLKGSAGDDAFIAGESVVVQGSIGDMLIAAGETVLLDGNVAGETVLAGRQVRITESTRISGNLLVAADRIILEGGQTNGWARIAGKSVSLDGLIGGYVIIYSSDVTFGENYQANGGTKIISSRPVYRENLGVIPGNLDIEVHRPPVLLYILFQTWFYLSLLVTGIALLLLFRPLVTDLYQFSTERFWSNIGVGLLSLLGIPLAIFILFLPLVTIPLAVILGIAYAFSLFFSYLLVALVLGMQVWFWIHKEPVKATWYWALALGLILIAIVTHIPFIGWLINLLLLFFGSGSVVAYMWQKYKMKPE